ncbi:MAG: hypothetical protein AAFN68_03015 [Pseudomonadota bacterium]
MRWILAMAATLLMNAAVAEGTKIAVVDMERALFLSNVFKSSAQDFENANQ